MVTCRSPWQKAVTTDECFSEFLVHEDFLLEMLPLSRQANALFRHIFTFNPEKRVTIPSLRKGILAIDTFFMSDEDIVRAPEAVRVAAEYCGWTAPPEVEPKHAGRPQWMCPKAITTEQFFIVGSASSSGESWDSEESSSEGDSDGPTTPATHPQVPAIEITLDIKLDDGGAVQVAGGQESKKTKTARSVPVAPAATF